ncbi:MAG: hypothetical protein U0326_29575 [Polyangiales bacterium]
MPLLLRLSRGPSGASSGKLLSVFAGEASGLLAGPRRARGLRLPHLAAPATRTWSSTCWRHEDAHRNALNGHCYWLLRHQGFDDAAATKKLNGVSVAERNELLHKHGINFNDVPAWQKRGVGTRWEDVTEEGTNPADRRDGLGHTSARSSTTRCATTTTPS